MMSQPNARMKGIAPCTFLAMLLLLTAVNLPAQEGRKPISNPTPAYPEIARKLHLAGVVKVQVVIAPDEIIGGHPLLVNAVEDTLKKWKYAPSSAETEALLEFNFHP